MFRTQVELRLLPRLSRLAASVLPVVPVWWKLQHLSKPLKISWFSPNLWFIKNKTSAVFVWVKSHRIPNLHCTHHHIGYLFSTGRVTSTPWPGLACTLAESGISLSMGIRGALGRGRRRTTGLKPPSESKNDVSMQYGVSPLLDLEFC